MRVIVLAVGTPGGPGLAGAVRAYEERAGRYFDLEVIEVRPAPGGLGDAEGRRREGEALRERLPGELESFALTRDGKGLTSGGLARHLERTATYGRAGVAFLVGGARGLDEATRAAADHRLSLSPMTLPHGLARLVLAEQLYRAGTIARGEPYHRGDG